MTTTEAPATADTFLPPRADAIKQLVQDAQAELDAQGGIDVPALFTLDGTLASTHYGYNQWGRPYWRLTKKETVRYGKQYVDQSQAAKPETRARNLRAKGFTTRTIRAHGPIDIHAGGDQASSVAVRIATTEGGE